MYSDIKRDLSLALGILDKDEIMIYHTSPLKVDTDGDGFGDGYEVQRGFNPNGRGKLPV